MYVCIRCIPFYINTNVTQTSLKLTHQSTTTTTHTLFSQHCFTPNTSKHHNHRTLYPHPSQHLTLCRLPTHSLTPRTPHSTHITDSTPSPLIYSTLPASTYTLNTQHTQVHTSKSCMRSHNISVSVYQECSEP